MSFDETQPTDTTKLRSLGVVIRPNWVAIKEADSTFIPYGLNLLDLTAAVIPAPSNISTAYQFYCASDGAMVGPTKELFGINPAGDTIQFTKGSPSKSAALTSTFLPGGLILKCGVISTSVAGTATINWNFTNNLYSATLTRVKNSGLNNRFSLYFSSSPTKASGSILLVDNNGNGFDNNVYWQAIGD